MNPELERELIDSLRSGKGVAEVIEKIMEGYSVRVGKAISPMGGRDSPFILAVLKAYEKFISNQYPFAEKLANELLEAGRLITLSVPLKDDGQK